MDLEQSWWSCSGLSRSERLWEASSSPKRVWMMTIRIWSAWDKNEVARRGRGEPGTVMVVLDGVMVIWSGFGGFD